MSARRVRAVRLPGIPLCLVLGLVTAIAVAWAAAAFVPLEPNSAVRIGLTPAGTRISSGDGWTVIPPTTGVVATDGDHLQPWLLRLDRLGSQRLMWFEKGRIYSRPDIGPPGGSSAAVANWSLAISTRQNPGFVHGELKLPANLGAAIEADAQPVWGVMEDRRGWPLLAFKWQAVAPRYEMPVPPPVLPTGDDEVYAVRWAIPLSDAAHASGSFAELRSLPIMPVWAGLAADTLIFAGAWWLVLLAPRPLRAGLRRRRGRCPSCAYDLRRDLAGGCPECGWNRPPAA